MTEKKDFIKVRTYLIIKHGDKVSINDNGTFNPSEQFLNRINEYDDRFRSAILTFVNDAIGLHNWAVRFAEFIEEEEFWVSVWCDTESDFNLISSIILYRVTDKKLKFHLKGTIDDYIHKEQ